MKFNKKLKTIFLDMNSKEFNTNEKVNIVLSPTLYWVKKLSLPVKSTREAKKLLPSIFEDTLPHGNYSYYIYKYDDDFIAFAYEDKKILDLLSQKGIKNSQIANLYFAQTEFHSLEKIYKIDKEQVLCLKDDIVIVLPSILFTDTKMLQMSSIQHSKHTITLTQFGHIVDKKSLYKITTILIAFIILIGIELFITTKKIDENLIKKELIFTKYNLKSTMFQNRSMLKKYTAIHKKQMKIREYITTILNIKLPTKSKLTKLTLKDKTLLFSFNNITQIKKKSLEKSLTKKKIIFHSSLKDKILKVEIEL